MSNTEEWIRQLEAAWDLDTGFLGQLREGHFDVASAPRFMDLLRSIDLSREQSIDRRLVQLLWFIPTFMGWQVERVAKRGGDVKALQRVVSQVEDLFLGQVFGAP